MKNETLKCGPSFLGRVCRVGRLMALGAGLAVLASCGGGGGTAGADASSTATISAAPITGKVIDGYIRGATVFWDCANSWRVEDAQISVKSGVGGVYAIPDAPLPSCVLRAHAGIDAVDEDTNLAFVRAVVFSAMPGRPVLISPLTTLVAMGAGTEAEVAMALGIPGDLTRDFLSEGFKDTVSHNAAKVTNLQLQSLSLGATSLTEGNSSAAKAILVNTRSLLTTLPVTYSLPNSEALSWLNAKAGRFDTFKLPSVATASPTAVNGKMGFSASQTELLKETLALAINKQALHANLISFNLIDESDLAGLNSRLTAAFGDSDEVITLMQARAAEIGVLNAEFEAALRDSNKFLDIPTAVTLLTNQTRILYGSAQVIAGFSPVAYVKGSTSFLNFGSTATNKLRNAKAVANQLRRFAGRVPACLDSINSAVLFIDAVVGGRDLQDDDIAEASNIFLGAAACVATFSRSESGLTKVLNGVASGAKVVFFLDLISGLEAAKFVVDIVTSFPPLAQVGMVANGSFDVAIGILASWKAIEEFNQAMAKGILVKSEELALLSKPILEKVYRDYKVRILEARVNPKLSPTDSACNVGATVIDLICVAPNQSPTTAFESLTNPLAINSPITGSIRVTDPGDQVKYLRVHVGRALNGSDCQIDIGDYNSLQEPGVKAFSGCASMTSAAGNLFLKLEASDSRGLSSEVVRAGVVVIASSVATEIPIPATAFVRGTNVALSANGFGADAVMNAPPYGSAPNAAEWDIVVPTAGRYELFANYAAALSRPVTISFGGVVKFTNALSAVTGGWFPANRQSISQGFVDLPAGAMVMRVARGDVFAHIQGFTLVPVARP